MTSYPLTTFYVKNNTDKTVNFKTSVEKLSSMGAYQMTLPFTVLPQDSVLARRVNFKNGASPNQWFTQFIIFPVEGVILNNPNNPQNWIMSKNSQGKITYTFNLAR